MIAVIENANESLVAILAGAATVDPNFSLVWNGTGGPANPTGSLTDTTTKTLITGVNGQPRTVTSLEIYNGDASAAVVTVSKVVSGTSYPLTKTSIPAKGRLRWSKDGLEVVENGA